MAVRAHRATQLRYRRPGQTIAPPPEELRAVEKTAFVGGAPLTTTIENLDRALSVLQDFEASFLVDSFGVFEHGSDGVWRPKRRYDFGGAGG